jgi:hypothetical protein
MAINVNTVYRTVLAILNKEQRGYMTPDQFNKAAAQAQLDIFNKYFDELNQLTKTSQPGTDYADRLTALDEKMSIFKVSAAATGGTLGVFSLPATLRELGNVVYNDIEVQRLSRDQFYNINKSDYTKPSLNYPIYLYEGSSIKVYPVEITTGVVLNYIRQIANPKWGYISAGVAGNYQYASGSSVDFELHTSEETKLILSILQYAGVTVKDTDIVNFATLAKKDNPTIDKQ